MDNNKVKSSLKEAASFAVSPSLSVTTNIVKAMINKSPELESLSSTTKKVKDNDGNEHDIDKSEDELVKDLNKVDFWSEVSKKKAQVAQEMAIASRISTAESVEIEEFFDTSGQGKSGFSFSNKPELGLSGKGQRISKRVYKFTGFNESTEAVSDVLSSILDIQKDEDTNA